MCDVPTPEEWLARVNGEQRHAQMAESCPTCMRPMRSSEADGPISALTGKKNCTCEGMFARSSWEIAEAHGLTELAAHLESGNDSIHEK